MSIDKKELVRKAFDAASVMFDEIGPRFFRYYGNLLVEKSDIQPDDIVLDIACGKGASTFPAGEKLSGSGNVTGIDISSGMIAECNKRLEQADCSNITFKVVDAEHLTFEDSVFDKVLCGFGLFFLPDIARGIEEIKRVLKPEGRLIFSSWDAAYHNKWLAELADRYTAKPLINNTLEEFLISAKDFRTIAGIESVLLKMNLKKIAILTEQHISHYKDEDEWIETRWQTGSRIDLERVPENRFDELKRDIYAYLKKYKDEEGIKIPISAFITIAAQ